jgi:hypothetical protein
VTYYYHTLHSTYDDRVDPPRRRFQFHARITIPPGMEHVWCVSDIKFETADVDQLRLFSTSNRLKQGLLDRLTTVRTEWSRK